MAEPEEGLVESLRALARMLEPLPDALGRAARSAHQAVRGCDHASVSLIDEDGAVTTVAATDDRTLRLDALQYEAGEGPCLTAIRTGVKVQVDEFARETRFRAFSAAAAADGIGSCLSLPLTVAGETVGGLNLYGQTVGAYDAPSVAASLDVTGHASAVLAGARAHERSLKLVEQFQVAMASRAEIEQAKGILMVRSHCDADRAFDILRRASQRQNVKLRAIAHTIVTNAVTGVTEPLPGEDA
jgi:GAF domain-containing protein